MRGKVLCKTGPPRFLHKKLLSCVCNPFSARPGSNRPPFDTYTRHKNLYSRMLYQLSYRRVWSC
jgi:hypothetical protein